jgi:hypothetical protein
MYYYKIAEITLQSFCRLTSFEPFSCDSSEADVILVRTDKQPPQGRDLISGTIVHRRLEEGWFFQTIYSNGSGVYANKNYTRLQFFEESNHVQTNAIERIVRVALECLLVRRGYVSLHAAAVEVQGKAYAFTGPSGIGKSSRADAWRHALGASLISGDRPLICVRDLKLYGVPWDGKEQCFRNVCYPLNTIFEVRRSKEINLTPLNFSQRRDLLMSQCFIPMWDTTTALIQLENIMRLAEDADIVRAFCGASLEDVHVLYDLIKKR